MLVWWRKCKRLSIHAISKIVLGKGNIFQRSPEVLQLLALYTAARESIRILIETYHFTNITNIMYVIRTILKQICEPMWSWIMTIKSYNNAEISKCFIYNIHVEYIYKNYLH